MGERDIFQRHSGESVDAWVREVWDPDSNLSREEQITQIQLVLRFYGGQGEDSTAHLHMGYLRPDQREIREKMFERHNLDYFADGQRIDAERGFEMYLLSRLLGKLAQADPCISGGQGRPLVFIQNIGGRAFNPEEIKEIYTTVMGCYSREHKVRKEAGDFAWPCSRRAHL
jgi:hypothetical protein